MPTPSASWDRSPSPQFPDVWKGQNIKICSECVKKTKKQYKIDISAWFVEYCDLKKQISRAGVLYLVALCWTHLSRAFLAPPCRGGGGFLLTGGLVVSVLLVELSSEEVLLYMAWSAGRLLVSSSIWRGNKKWRRMKAADRNKGGGSRF